MLIPHAGGSHHAAICECVRKFKGMFFICISKWSLVLKSFYNTHDGSESLWLSDSMLLAYWQCWSFFKAHLISLLASFNPELSLQYSFSSTLREEGIRMGWPLSGFISLALLCIHWRAENPTPSAANLSPVVAGKCAPFRGVGKVFLLLLNPSARKPCGPLRDGFCGLFVLLKFSFGNELPLSKIP